MQKMLQNVIVVAKHGDDYIDDCLDSLSTKYPVRVIDTSKGGHPSGAYIKAYREIPAQNYLFIQDSMQALQYDVIEPFKEIGDVVGWGSFPLFFDTIEQAHWVENQYHGASPEFGIFGPVFFATRNALETLDDLDLFPETPQNKLQAQGTERAWAWAFQNADIDVKFLGTWNKSQMEQGLHPPFKKTWGARV